MIEFFLRKKVLVNLITVFVVCTGVLMLGQLKRASYPDVKFDILKITTTYPGASAEDVEVNVSKKIEDEILTVRDIDKIVSASLENLSIIYVWVELSSSDPDQVKDEIRRAVDRVSELPKEIDDKPQIEELKSSNVAVIEVAVTGAVDETILRQVAKDLEEQINEIKGVSEISLVGYRDREVKVLADLEQMAQQYVSLNEISQAIASRNVKAAGGTLESFTSEKKIVTFSEFDDPSDVKNVIVRKSFDGKHIKLSEIANIESSFEDPDILVRTNGQKSINLLIRSQSGADIIDISDDIKSLLQTVAPGLPDKVSAQVVVDYSRYTENLLGIVQTNAVIGFFMVLIVLFVFLNRYTAFWTAFGIPVSFLGAMIFFPLFHIDINFISLITLVLVLGMLVDDAIVVAENISRYREDGMGPIQAAIKGAHEVKWPVTATILTTIIAFVSLWFMTGVSGKFVRQIPTVVILTLVMSLLECLFILPSHIAHSPFREQKPQRWFEDIKKSYEKLVRYVVRHRWLTIGVFVGFLILGVTVHQAFMKVNLFPYDDVDVFYVIAELPEGSSLDQTAQRMVDIEKFVKQIPASEMVNFTTTVGHHDRDVYGATAGLRHNWAMATIFLKPAQERERNSEDIMQELENKLNNVKGFTKLELDKFSDGPPVGRPITLTLVCNDDAKRKAYADKFVSFLNGIKGTKNLDVDEKLGKDELLLKPDYELMAELGITSLDLAQTIRTAYSGLVVTSITRGGEEIDFRVQLKKGQRQNIDVLKQLQVMNRDGRLIQIGTFTQLVPSRGLEVIKHYNGRRAITVTGDIDDKVTSSEEVNELVRKQFQKEIDQQPDLRLVFGGEEKATQESMQSFFFALLYSLVAIYFVLVILFDSFLQPLIIVAVVPFGLAGVVMTFFTFGMPISFLGIIGTLGLIGVMVNDSLVMVSHLNDLRREHQRLTPDLMVEGCKVRLRPVMLTTITTVVGLIPTILGLGGYEPFIIPLVLSLAGGLVFATPITLVLVPVLYSFMTKNENV